MKRMSMIVGFGLVLAAGSAAAQPAAPSPISAQTFTSGTTGDLGRLCGATAQDPAYLAAIHFCHGMMIGVGQMHRLFSGGASRPTPIFCLPDPSPTIDQAAAAFAAWAAASPQEAGTPAAVGLLRFANTTYPCAARGQQRARGR